MKSNTLLKHNAPRALTALALGIAGLVLALACQMPETGINPIGAIPGVPRKQLATTMVPPHDRNPHFVWTALHVDVERYNPLNAKDFFFEGRHPDGSTYQIPFFEHVILGYAYLDRDARGYAALRLTPSLQYVLDNSRTYIWPLTLSGIKVLIEVRSGRFADSEEGRGIGLGTLDMPAVNQFIHQFSVLVDRFGIDGFEFNDIGGGYRSLPPHTRHLTRFGSDQPMYPPEMFQDDDGNELSSEEIKEILWMEGGQNLTDMMIYVNEHLRFRQRVVADFGSAGNDNNYIETVRTLLVRNTNHGGRMPTMVRPAFTPDAYTGATPYVLQNLVAVVNDARNEMIGTAPNFPFLMMWDSVRLQMMSQPLGDFAPLVIDLSVRDRMSATEAGALARLFAGTFQIPNRFGTLYLSNLPTSEEDPDIAEFLSAFAVPIFARNVRLHDGGGNHPRPQW